MLLFRVNCGLNRSRTPGSVRKSCVEGFSQMPGHGPDTVLFCIAIDHPWWFFCMFTYKTFNDWSKALPQSSTLWDSHYSSKTSNITTTSREQYTNKADAEAPVGYSTLELVWTPEIAAQGAETGKFPFGRRGMATYPEGYREHLPVCNYWIEIYVVQTSHTVSVSAHRHKHQIFIVKDKKGKCFCTTAAYWQQVDVTVLYPRVRTALVSLRVTQNGNHVL